MKVMVACFLVDEDADTHEIMEALNDADIPGGAIDFMVYPSVEHMISDHKEVGITPGYVSCAAPH